MAGKMSTLLYGNLAEVDELLEEGEIPEHMLRAALQNICRHIQQLEARLDTHIDFGSHYAR